MHTKILLTILATAFAMPIWGRPQIDKIVMKNGDQLTCEIKKLERGVLYVSFEYVDGTVSMAWLKVAHVESSQLFIVHTAGGAVYWGGLRTPDTPADQPVQIEVVDTNEQATPLRETNIVEMNQSSASPWRRLSGNVSSGLSYTRGNNSTQYNLSTQLYYRATRWGVKSDYSSSLSANSGSPTTTRNQATFTGYKLLRHSNWFVGGVGNVLQSAHQGIDRQSTLGTGIGRFLTNSNRSRISLLGGFAWQGTRYSGESAPPGRQDLIVGLASANIQLFRFKKTELDLSALAYPTISQRGRVRSSVNTSYRIQIINNLWWNITAYGNWDNQPPAGLAGSDFGATSGITYSFN